MTLVHQPKALQVSTWLQLSVTRGFCMLSPALMSQTRYHSSKCV